jgi:hypothetical protein
MKIVKSSHDPATKNGGQEPRRRELSLSHLIQSQKKSVIELLTWWLSKTVAAALLNMFLKVF